MTRLSADYGADIVGASRSALLDLSLTLRSYDNALVLVGGWVPYFLIEEAQRGRSGFTHVGSIDIDFVVDADVVGEDEYATIVQLLTERGWVQAPNSRFSFLRSTRAPGNRRDDEVAVDFLTTEPQSVGRHLCPLIFGEVPDHQGEPDVVLHGQVGKECEVLEDHSQLALMGGHVGDVLVVDEDPTLVGPDVAGEAPQRRGLAAARRTQQAADRAFGQGEGQVGNDLPFGVRLRDRVEDQFSHRGLVK